jgi:hypothetical protein
MSRPSRHVELALYAEDTAVMATPRQLVLLVEYLETYLSDLERWLSEWRIAINVSKRSVTLFTKTGSRIPKPRLVHLSRESIQWVVTPVILGDP